MTQGPIWVSSTGGNRVAVHVLTKLRPGEHLPPLLILPANGFHGLCYGPLADTLQDKYRVYAIDFQGFGLSEGPPTGHCVFAAFLQDLMSTVEQLSLSGCFVFGHSSGGLVAARAEQTCPGIFRGLYLYEPVIFAPQLSAGNDALAAMARKRRRSFPSGAAALGMYARKAPFASFRADCLAAYVAGGFETRPGGECVLRCTPEHEARVFLGVPSICTSGFAALPQVKCKTLIACGCSPKWAAFKAAEEAALPIAEALPRETAGYEQYEGLGHLGPFENPAFVGSRVAAWMLAAATPAPSPGPFRQRFSMCRL